MEKYLEKEALEAREKTIAPEVQDQIDDLLQETLNAVSDGNIKMAQYYEGQARELGFNRKDDPGFVEDYNMKLEHYKTMRNLDSASDRYLRSSDKNNWSSRNAMGDTSSAWSQKAKQEFETNGESDWYKSCKRNAERCRNEGF